MTPERFEELKDEFHEKEALILEYKQYDYSEHDDRLQNFREVAAFMGMRPAEVALTYLLKHIQAISIAVKTGEYVWAWETNRGGEGLKQRIADGRNYLLLLAACLEEETNEEGDIKT
jgi:hypothetical protein